MRQLSIPAIIFALVSAGCAVSSTTEPPIDVRGVTFETYPGPFCGRCDTTKITVADDGRAWIEQGYWAGDYRDWRVTRREAQISAESLARFRARVDEYRPRGQLALDDQPPCQTFEADNSGINIAWRDERGADRLAYNFGCDSEVRRAMADALRTAPALLEVPGLRIRELGGE
ncbi:MAG: hypothetical protein R3C16_10220 [Hyphomonadaceae bacterium]